MKRFTTVEADVSLAIDILHDALGSYRARGKGYKAIERALAELRPLWPKEFERREFELERRTAEAFEEADAA